MTSGDRRKKRDTTRRMLEIESSDRLSSQTIGDLSDRPGLMKQYLEASIANTFSELIFRLTHEKYAEAKAETLWLQIVKHRKWLGERLERDPGMLVATLDFMSNISGDISNPKIMDDLRIEEAATLATRDAMTGLYVRGVFDFSLASMVREHREQASPLSLLLADVDDFKDVNDRFGHPVGDAVLKRIGGVIGMIVRESDIAARYGGEEFGLVLPGTAVGEAVMTAERFRRIVGESCVDLGPTVTVSIGVAGLREPDVASATDLVRSADRALYRAKRDGKNRVERDG